MASPEAKTVRIKKLDAPPREERDAIPTEPIFAEGSGPETICTREDPGFAIAKPRAITIDLGPKPKIL